MSHLRQLSQTALGQYTNHYLEAAKTSGQVVTSGAWTKLTYDTPSFNDCFTVASSVFTCTVAGWYAISSAAYEAGNSGIAQLYVSKNGSSVNVTNGGEYRTSLSSLCRIIKIVYLSVGDTVEIMGYFGTTANPLVSTSNVAALRMVRL